MLNCREVPSLYALLPRDLEDTREAEESQTHPPLIPSVLSYFVLFVHSFTCSSSE